jgi:dolichol kinase
VGSLGNVLSFCLFTLAILVGIEIVANFVQVPFEEGKLGAWFREVFLATMYLFACLWIRTYYPYFVLFLFMIVALAILVLMFFMFQVIIRRTVPKISMLKNKSQRTREEFIPVYGAMLLMTLFILILTHIRSIEGLWQFFSKGK